MTKDHVCKSYHFSMIKRVTQGIIPEEFGIAFSKGTFELKAVVHNQRDYIVAMIKVAMEEINI